MNTTLCSFINIFGSKFTDDRETIRVEKIIIPIIQRDYAQGRDDPDIEKVRDRFLNSLHDAVIGQSITLDFVYGDIDKRGVMTPLDGQQRLTTLFLLHWYAARKAKASADKTAFLANFGYETRINARDFCVELTKPRDNFPLFNGKLSDEIKDQAWFPLEWLKDPTISSMLNMLDAINDKFKDVSNPDSDPNLWDQLNNKAITFYFLPICDMGPSDEIYIRMNSRG